MKSIKTSLFAGFCAVLILAAALLSGCENVGGRQNNLFSIDEKSEQSNSDVNATIESEPDDANEEESGMLGKVEETIGEMLDEPSASILNDYEPEQYDREEISSTISTIKKYADEYKQYVGNEERIVSDEWEYVVLKVPFSSTQFAVITAYLGDSAVINVPAEIDGYHVSRFEPESIDSKVTDITLPDTVYSTTLTFVGKNMLTEEGKGSSLTETEWYNNQPDGPVYLGKILMGFKGDIPENYVLKPKMGTVSIAPGAFSGSANNTVSNIQCVFMPNSIIEIGEGAFSNCQSIKMFRLSKNLLTVESSAFAGCSSLSCITFPKSLQDISAMYLFGINHDISISINFEGGVGTLSQGTIPKYTLESCYPNSFVNYDVNNGIPSLINMEEYGFTWNIKDGVLTISGQGDMPECESDSRWPWYLDFPRVNKVVFSEGITSIGNSVFYNEDDLYDIGTGFHIKEVVFPKSLKRIGWGAFIGSDMTSVELPEGVTEIGDSAFASCEELESITLPDSLETIEGCAFRWCSSLSSIEIPSGIKLIETSAFESAWLKEITFKGTVEKFGIAPFYDTKLNKIEFPLGLDRVEDGFAQYSGELTTVVIPEGVTSIGYHAFFACGKLKDVYLPASLEFIDEEAFSDETYTDGVGWTTHIVDCTIHAPAGSYAEQYAKENNIPFEAQ